MLWKTNLGKILIAFLVSFVIVGLPIIVYFIILSNQPLQTEHVEIVSKRTEERADPASSGNETRYYVTFKFPDDSERDCGIHNVKIYDLLQEGDTGMLSYKQFKNSTSRYLRFVSFEKDS